MGTILSRSLGFVREIVMAAVFGTTGSVDQWLMAGAIPNILFTAFNSALQNVIVPVMAGNASSSTDEKLYVREMLGTVGIVSVLVTLMVEGFAPTILRHLAPGFSPRALAQTVVLTRIMAPTVVLWSGSGIAVGVLQSKRIYGPTTVAPTIVNVVRVVTILSLGWADGIVGIAWGFLLAVASQWGYLMFLLRSKGFNIRPLVQTRHPWTLRTWRLVGPLLMMTATGAIGVIVDRVLASSLQKGTIAALNYSLLLTQLPIGILVNSLALPAFTIFSEQWNSGRVSVLYDTLKRGMELATIISVPFLAFFLFERNPLVALVYQRGVFNTKSTVMTAHLMKYWTVAIPAFAWGALLGRAILSLQKAKPILTISSVTVTTNIAFDLILVSRMGGAGLALGTALAGWISTLLTWAYLERLLNPAGHKGRAILRSLFPKYVMPSVAVFAAGLPANLLGLTLIVPGVIELLVHVLLGGLLVGVVWFGVLGVQTWVVRSWRKWSVTV